jgi:hypothetical protein
LTILRPPTRTRRAKRWLSVRLARTGHPSAVAAVGVAPVAVAVPVDPRVEEGAAASQRDGRQAADVDREAQRARCTGGELGKQAVVADVAVDQLCVALVRDARAQARRAGQRVARAA